MKKLFLFMLVAALAFVGCSDDDNNQTTTVGKNQILDTYTVEAGKKLIIEGTVKSLTVKGGDVIVEKDGIVNSINVPGPKATPVPTITIKANHNNIGPITNAGGAKIYWSAYNAADLRTVLGKPANVNSGALLGSNISSEFVVDGLGSYIVGVYDATNALLYKPTAYDGYVLDGQGFTLQGAADQNVLFIVAHDVVVKNLTVSQTAANKTAHANNGIQVYWVKGVKFENVTATNCGRAGIIVNASTATATDLKTSANVWGGVNVSLPGSPSVGAQTPELTLVSGELKDNFKVYVDAYSFENYKVTVPSGWTNSDVTTSGKVVRAYYPTGQAPTPVA